MIASANGPPLQSMPTTNYQVRLTARRNPIKEKVNWKNWSSPRGKRCASFISLRPVFGTTPPVREHTSHLTYSAPRLVSNTFQPVPWQFLDVMFLREQERGLL